MGSERDMADSYLRTLTIEEIDGEIARGFRTLLFQSELERQYEADITPRHKAHLFVASLIGLVSYDLFLFHDLTMIRDVFSTAVIFRLGIFTPAALFGIIMLSWPWSLKTMEKIAGFIAVLAVALVMGLYSLSDSVYRSVYQYGPLMIMVFAVVVQRIRVRYCIPTVAAMFVVQAIATFHSTALDAKTFQAFCTICATISMLVLFAAYGFEHERRRNYLLSIRGQLMNDQLDRYTRIDPLTGLWNRRHLDALMTAAWAKAEHVPQIMTVMILDIDRFKLFNDTYGHSKGDVCLQRIGACARQLFDPYGDVVVRLGGEEFLIFIAGMDAAAAQNAAHLLRHGIHCEAIPYAALGEGAVVTASIGVATGLAPGVSSAALIAAADTALYEAKRAGRDRVCTAPVVSEIDETATKAVA
jgi:diguanylate cyclase (GGDEF)-like protein